MCLPILRKNVFTTAAIDIVDHNPSSISAEGSSHGIGISLLQHITEEEPGLVQPPISDNYSTFPLQKIP